MNGYALTSCKGCKQAPRAHPTPNRAHTQASQLTRGQTPNHPAQTSPNQPTKQQAHRLPSRHTHIQEHPTQAPTTSPCISREAPLRHKASCLQRHATHILLASPGLCIVKYAWAAGNAGGDVGTFAHSWKHVRGNRAFRVRQEMRDPESGFRTLRIRVDLRTSSQLIVILIIMPKL